METGMKKGSDKDHLPEPTMKIPPEAGTTKTIIAKREEKHHEDFEPAARKLPRRPRA